MILVCGYYGFGNAGDEAILSALCADLVSLGIGKQQIYALSANPTQTEKTHGVNAVDRYDYRKIYALLRQTNLFISGGGSLLQDSTSWRTIPYYLGIIEMARARGVPVIVYGQGIGPVKNPVYRLWIRRVMNNVEQVILRDRPSAELLERWKVKSDLIRVTSDPVFRWEPQWQRAHFPGITLNLRPYGLWKSDFHAWVDVIRTWMHKFNWPVYFVPLGPGDQEMGIELNHEIRELQVLRPRCWQEAAQSMASTEVSISMRLHGLIFAAMGGSLPIGLEYDPKVAAIANQLGVLVHGASPTRQLTQDILHVCEYRSSYSEAIMAHVEVLHKYASRNRELVGVHLTRMGMEDKDESENLGCKC